jgi:GNAT acetyltransferase-like protein
LSVSPRAWRRPPVRSVVTQRFLDLQIARLLRKHESLNAVTFTSVPLPEAPLPQISALITAAWKRAFGSRPSVCFCPEFLRFNCGEPSNPGSATLAHRDGDLCGTALNIPFDFEHNGQNLASSVITGLCSASEFEGSGMIEMLLAQQARHAIDVGRAFSMHWRSSKEGKGKTGEPSRSGLTHAARIPLYAKALDCPRAAELGGLGILEALGIRGLRMVYPPGKRLPRGFETQNFTPDCLVECATFFHEFQPGTSLVRRFTPERFRRKLAYREGPIRAAALLLRHHGRLRGIIYGYRNPVGEKDAYFSLDGAVFHPSLTLSQKRAFLSQIEAMAQDQQGCFAVLAPGSACQEPLRRCGYLPIKHYLFGATPYPNAPELAPADVASLFVELR